MIYWSTINIYLLWQVERINKEVDMKSNNGSYKGYGRREADSVDTSLLVGRN